MKDKVNEQDRHRGRWNEGSPGEFLCYIQTLPENIYISLYNMYYILMLTF